jgi:hypothetical protein
MVIPIAPDALAFLQLLNALTYRVARRLSRDLTVCHGRQHQNQN